MIDRAGRQASSLDQPNTPRQLPTPGKHLASRYLGLLAASGEQTPDGETLSAAQRGGPSVIQREQVQTLVRELGGITSEPLADGWKGQTLPLGSDPAHAVSMYFRDHDLDPDDDASGNDGDHAETQRAVFDVSFSRLGRCQIDALCQRQRFDLLVRSERAFLADDQQDIAALFNAALEIAGMQGEIGFKVGSFFEPARSSTASKDVRT